MSYFPLRIVSLPIGLLLLALLPVCGATANAQISQKGFHAATPAGKGSGKSGAPQPTIRPVLAQPLLPASFAGSPREGNIVIQPSPAAVDPSHTAVLTEAGFTEADTARYAGTGAASWTVEVLRFGDATGAFSAFTFYRDPSMQPQSLAGKPIGENSAEGPDVFLVQKAASLVRVRRLDAPLSSGVAEAQAGLNASVQALVETLPMIQGPEAVPPTLPGLLPEDGLDRRTVHYAIGPAAYHGPLPANIVDFSRDAEAATAVYHLHGGSTAVLTLLMLPTPQIAGTELRAAEALPNPSLRLATRRSGPLVGVVSGAGVSLRDAQALLGEIHYVADVTIDQPQGYTSEVAKAAKLLLGIAYLTALLLIAAVVIAIFLGGGRLLMRRLQGKPDSSMNDDDFISLKL